MTWWKTKAWPWLKKNWLLVLLFPLGLVALVMAVFGRGGEKAAVVIDPTRKADARAAKEKTRREKELGKEEDRLEAEVQRLEVEQSEKLESLDEEQRQRYREMRDDPEAVVEWLRKL